MSPINKVWAAHSAPPTLFIICKETQNTQIYTKDYINIYFCLSQNHVTCFTVNSLLCGLWKCFQLFIKHNFNAVNVNIWKIQIQIYRISTENAGFLGFKSLYFLYGWISLYGDWQSSWWNRSKVVVDQSLPWFPAHVSKRVHCFWSILDSLCVNVLRNADKQQLLLTHIFCQTY